MNKIITIIGLGLAVAGIVFGFNQAIWALVLSFIITSAVASCGFWLESRIEVKGNSFINKIYYYLSRKDRNYNFESVNCIYSVQKDKTYESKTTFKLKSNRNDLTGIQDRYRWSAPSTKAVVTPVYSNHRIIGKHQEDAWYKYTIDFGDVCNKNSVISTGAIISNLIDTEGVALPFLSYTVTRKTKQLIMTVEFDKEKKPTSPVLFKIQAGGNAVGKPIPLKYDKRIDGYSMTVNYPRKGWQYMISWE